MPTTTSAQMSSSHQTPSVAFCTDTSAASHSVQSMGQSMASLPVNGWGNRGAANMSGKNDKRSRACLDVETDWRDRAVPPEPQVGRQRPEADASGKVESFRELMQPAHCDGPSASCLLCATRPSDRDARRAADPAGDQRGENQPADDVPSRCVRGGAKETLLRSLPQPGSMALREERGRDRVDLWRHRAAPLP